VPGFEVRQRVKNSLQVLAAASEVRRTDRTTMLAVAELARRHGGEAPAGEFRDLTPFELKAFSQNGEDGVIAEVLRRCGARERWFVEFGASEGLENNCVALADLLGWQGLFIEAGEREFATLEAKYRSNARVATVRSMVTAQNVARLFRDAGVPDEPDVLSIDVDGADYWIWEALEGYRPRLVVIEYNATLDPARRLVQPRDHGPWDGTSFFGASLGALEALGASRGYRLVHTDLTGSNAFFVREDLAASFPASEAVPRRAANLFLRGERHPPDPHGRRFVDLAIP
jgi:hypothetical protein